MRKRTERVALMGLLLGIMLILGYIEHLIPLPGHDVGIRVGLSNAVLLFAVYMLGIGETFALMVTKVILSGFLFSGFQAMMYSLAGGLLSVCAMAGVSRLKGVSVLGTSVAGAFFFNVGQGIVVLLVVPLLILQLPLVFAIGIVTGILTGTAARVVMRYVKVPSNGPHAPKRDASQG